MSRWLTISLVVLALLPASCIGGGETPSGNNSANPADVESNTKPKYNLADYPVFPDADAGADPAVSAEHGGKGFKGEGWETNTAFDLIGDPRAVKGGTLRETATDFPTTIRAVQRTLNGPRDAFVTKLNATGSSFNYSTYLGGSAHDGGGRAPKSNYGLEAWEVEKGYILACQSRPVGDSLILDYDKT